MYVRNENIGHVDPDRYGCLSCNLEVVMYSEEDEQKRLPCGRALSWSDRKRQVPFLHLFATRYPSFGTKDHWIFEYFLVMAREIGAARYRNLY